MNLRPLLFTVLIAVFSFNVDAQIATPEKGSTWVYDYVNAGSRGPKIATYERDSVLQGKSALVLDETFYEQADPRKQVYNYVGNIISIEDSLVMYYNFDKWDTLYDFGADLGDDWNYYFSLSDRDTLKAEVIKKGEDPNLGAFLILEYEFYDKHFDEIEKWKNTIHELTLGGTEYIVPWDNVVMQLDGQVGGPLQCFSNSQGRYSDRVWTAGGAACTDIIQKLDVAELRETKKFSIYPNPSAGEIYLRSSTNELPKRVSVMDVKGAIVYEAETLDQLSDLSPQLYFVKIERQDGLVEVHRVLVE